MDTNWLPITLRRQLKKSALARRVVTHLRGESRPFHKKIRFDDTAALPHKLYIGTHHKTGTVWLQRSFGTFARLSHSTLEHVQTGQHVQRHRHHIILDYRASQENADFSACRGLRMVRDPRDVLVSATLFHRRAEEPRLHKPGPDGRTYHERIADLSEEDALLFEMDNWSGRVIREMLAFEGGDTIRTIRYEEYLKDRDMVLWHPLLHWMGLSGIDLILAQQSLFERALFGQAYRGTGHVSTRKKGWQSYFTPRVEARFNDLFGDAPMRLGYGTTVPEPQDLPAPLGT